MDQIRYLTITALTKYIKYKFDNDIHLQDVYVEGEISNFKPHSSGHFYFTLKDKGASITAMMFSSNAKNVLFRPSDGMKVFVRGSLTVYERSGNYQIVCKELKSDGIGDLFLAFEQLKKELQEQGYFDQRYKKPIPRFPKAIGVITSPTGAAIRDIINTIKRRYSITKIIVYPALVQGQGAKESVASQIIKANEDQLVDTLIVGRGGGSIEDLWAFNEKIVADAIFESKIPIISAVGHEVDFTISDFVADIRAATPTAAAELATMSTDVLIESIKVSVNRMTFNINNIFKNLKTTLAYYDRHLEANNPLEKLRNKKEYLNNLNISFNRLITNILNTKNYQYNVLVEKLKALSPYNIMDKGFSISMSNNKILRSVKEVKVNDQVEIKLKDGNVVANIINIIDKENK